MLCLHLTHISTSIPALTMSSYSPFEGAYKGDDQIPDTPKGGIVESTPITTPSGASTHPGSEYAFTPPTVDFTDTLQSLVQMALKSASAPPFSDLNASSLLHCLSDDDCHRPTPSISSLKIKCVNTIKRQPSATSSTSGPTSVSTNPVVQGLLNKPSTEITVSDIDGRVMELATDRNGSRLLQKLLTHGGSDFVAKVIDEVEYNLMIIMCDTYANYMCQQLFQSATASQRTRMLSRLVPHFTGVARDRRGTHSLQALISHVSSRDEEELLAKTFSGKVDVIALDTHATHVLQQAISCCMERRSGSFDFVFREVASGLERLAIDPNALGVVKRCITHSSQRGYADILCSKIEKNLTTFVEDAYANYAVQHALETWARNPNTVELSERIIAKLVDKVAPMALHKFASNVAETAIKCATNCSRFSLIESLNYNDDSRMLSLMRSPFGVFVIGTAIKFAESSLQQGPALVLAIARNLKKLPEGRNKTKWEKLIS